MRGAEFGSVLYIGANQGSAQIALKAFKKEDPVLKRANIFDDFAASLGELPHRTD